MQGMKIGLIALLALMLVGFSGCGLLLAPVSRVVISNNPTSIKLGASVTMQGAPEFDTSILSKRSTLTWKIVDGPGELTFPFNESIYVKYTAPTQTTSNGVTIRATADTDTSKYAEVTILFVP
jgi:hypothetical protein